MFFNIVIPSAVLAGTTFLTTVKAQSTGLGLIVLANDATCPANSGTGVNANVLAVVTFDETATATANVLNIGNVNAPVSADIEVCLCVGADAELGSLTLPANLMAEALADLEAQATVDAAVSTAATAFDNLLALPGSSVAVSLVPTKQPAIADLTVASKRDKSPLANKYHQQ
ncbi:MAG: hypothetical protein CYPHOPRED_001216 [Cyphobasidiales sp. Tagirdzhanova-0007]|nr:MAG: hypothetical protein CYPHOPRED_001216 [Cyphobasidiales sp. Tagirdzhanova-0007]